MPRPERPAPTILIIGAARGLGHALATPWPRSSSGTAGTSSAPSEGGTRTDLGGPDGHLTIEESIPDLVNVLLAKRERPSLEYLDYLGRTVPW
jgi:hypothetical protein